MEIEVGFRRVQRIFQHDADENVTLSAVVEKHAVHYLQLEQL